jgi:hypothetical protein
MSSGLAILKGPHSKQNPKKSSRSLRRNQMMRDREKRQLQPC